ncbi:MAG: universal stress protein UspA [Pseudonocardiales bacterium]|nr:universal stress protein UspA [Jatrophihabitantaceae bacterium]MCW2603309.1 universal stress protein UspA [Pseudonocardiales bacterium]
MSTPTDATTTDTAAAAATAARTPAPTAGRIIVGVDGSEPSKEALRWAARISGATGAGITAVMTWSVSPVYGDTYFPDNWDPKGDASRVLTETVDAAFAGAERPANIDLVVAQGQPTKVLLEEGADAQMIVVGSRGHGGFTGLLLGSVSSAVAAHAKCPVLVVHGAPGAS